MKRQFDLGDESEDELTDALRQLEERQRGRGQKRPEAEEGSAEETAPGDRRAQEDVQEALEEILEQQAVAERRPRARAGLGPRARWILVGLVAVGLMVTAVVLTRPRPLPAPAASAREAVEGFWRALIVGDYEGATVYCPVLVERYGSRKQAAVRLREYFGGNPPVSVPLVGEAEEVADSEDLRVSYEVILRSTRPRRGECIVRYAGEGQGYVIVAGP